MKVLLLHPEDEFVPPEAGRNWDVVVDFARAPAATYQAWSQAGGGRTLSLYSMAEPVADLYRVRGLMRLGVGQMLDEEGMDWWDVASIMIEEPLRHCSLLHRLPTILSSGCELYASRPDSRFEALRELLGATMTVILPESLRRRQRIDHYRGALARLDLRTLIQILHDKYDPDHRLRRRFSRRPAGSGQPVVLLPSAYINVSRTEAAYAALVPEMRFLLVAARRSGRLESLPANLRMVSLDPYFAPVNQKELATLLRSWEMLRERLVKAAEEFVTARAVGILDRIPGFLRWTLAVRDAWKRIYQSETITACLSADDSNPYSRIPVILARQMGIPAIACTHGALDYRIALKTQYADFYLAKGEMERDYVLHVGGLAEEKVILGGPEPTPERRDGTAAMASKPWLVFFTEPYGTDGWRVAEVYRDLLPHLVALAESCGLQLVFKLHPFENVSAHRRLLRLCSPPEKLERIRVIAGPITGEIWQKARFVMTVQSTVALEATREGVPVFLCAWLGSVFGGYIRQYEKFGVGRALSSPAEMAEIPALLETRNRAVVRESVLGQVLDPKELRALLSGRRAAAGEASVSR